MFIRINELPVIFNCVFLTSQQSSIDLLMSCKISLLFLYRIKKVGIMADLDWGAAVDTQEQTLTSQVNIHLVTVYLYKLIKAGTCAVN